MGSKHYLVVGGSSGIGLELVKVLLNEGHQVTVLSRTSENLPIVENFRHIAHDILSEDLPAELNQEVLDGLVYCPGSINLKPFRALNTDQFRNDLEINLLGAVKVLQATEKSLKKSGHGSVVFFSTVAVGQGMPFHTSVAAAKGAIEGLTRSLAAEWAPKVRVNCIAPSLTNTPMSERLLSSPEKIEASANRHPLKKVGEPEDIANLAHFLLSEKSSWMTGQVIGLDGGLSKLRV